jgi:hypothetical protein
MVRCKKGARGHSRNYIVQSNYSRMSAIVPFATELLVAVQNLGTQQFKPLIGG